MNWPENCDKMRAKFPAAQINNKTLAILRGFSTVIKLRQLFFTLFSIGLTLLLSGCNQMAILDPKGIIAIQEKHLLITAVLLMLIVVVPVIILSLIFAFRYRAKNNKAKYAPNWAHSTTIEVVCWGIPLIIIAVLAMITWVSSHQLDPYKPLDTSGKPLTVQVVALDWKWLFIYPEQHIATVNYAQIPVHVPVRFLITADAPMNSFAIPQLAGQIYAMAGMRTKLHIMANEAGEYSGMSTNYSGIGFSDMKFTIKASSQKEFNEWVKQVQKSPEKLDMARYNNLAKPSINDPVKYFSLAADNLFNNIIMKFMGPGAQTMDMDPSMKASAHGEAKPMKMQMDMQ